MKFSDRIQRRGGLFLVVICAFALVSCGSKSEKKTGQSVARVDGYELTVHQLNSELKSVPTDTSKGEAALKSEALDSLINRRLLIAEAERNKIDRDPEVMQVIERQKGEVLIQAMLQRKAAEIAKPSADEVQTYYRSNPALFANRKVYDMQQLVLPAASFTPKFNALVDAGKPLDELASWLASNNVQFNRASTSPSTADLPQQIVKNIDALGAGKPFIVKDPSRVTIASLHLRKETPVSEETARPQIEQFLMAQKMRDAMASEMKRLRTAAKIEYLDGTIAPVAAPKGQVEKVAAESAVKPDDHISAGVSGLK
jgi:EpsD family peptidyl-prolyl cis-trans isomerase